MNMHSINDAAQLDLQQQVARLQALLEATRQVHAAREASDLLRQVLRIAVRELEMEAAGFGELVLGDAALLGDAAHGFDLADRDGQRQQELKVAAPGGRALTLYEIDFLEGLALQASVALENLEHQQRTMEFVRVQQDLEAARQLQRSLLPQRLPQPHGYSLAFRSDACYEVGGDSLDVVEEPGGTWLLVVADVAGKGLASAIMATSFRAALRSMAGLPLDKLAERLNQQQYEEGEEARRRYVTAIVVRFDAAAGVIEVVNCGHNPGLLLRPGDAEPVRIEASGPPMGLLPGIVYQSERHILTPGARLILYTDGLSEAGDDEEFGEQRVATVLGSAQGAGASDMLDALWAAVSDFAQGPQQDDRSALALCRAEREAQ